MPKRVSEAGLTLLELALSLAMGTVLITSFFVSYRGLMQAISLVANEMNATARVSEFLDSMLRELDRSEIPPTITPDGMQVNFQLGAVPVSYRLHAMTPEASQDTFFERQENGGDWVAVGPRRLIANFHPYVGTLKDLNGADVDGYNLVPMFAVNAGSATMSPQVLVHAVIQVSQDAPARYVGARSAPRLLN